MRPRNEAGEPLLTQDELQRTLTMVNDLLPSRLTTGMLAQNVGLTERYFTLMFQREMGMSAHAWVVRQRCIAAAAMLAVGTSTLEIADMVGFCSRSAFTHTFRKTFGITPGKYRQQIGGADD